MLIQLLGYILQGIIGNEWWWKVLQEGEDRMAPSIRPDYLIYRFQGLFRRLLGGKATPFKLFIFEGMASVLEVSNGLPVPIFGSTGHVVFPSHGSGLPARKMLPEMGHHALHPFIPHTVWIPAALPPAGLAAAGG